LDPVSEKGDSEVTYGIGAGCIDALDRTCVDVCPVDCIYEGNRKLYIHPEECIDCGACAVSCPQSAPLRLSDHRAEDEPIAFDDGSFFQSVLPSRDTPIGSPNGAASIGPVGVDTELVRQYQR
jgi:NAD-dependent dihydropyrimidine dehydrogenase PreA subunit